MTQTTTTELTDAIRRSLTQNETVTVPVGSEEDLTAVLAELYASTLCEDYDSTPITSTLLDVWGTTPDGSPWRLHLMQAERVGAARYSADGR